jgi:hypothetical protein
MPIPFKFKSIDAANVASKLPRPLQWAGGAALEGLKQVVDADNPASSLLGSVGVTIGPKAIPLMNEDGYLRKAAGTAIDDLGTYFKSNAPQSPFVKAALQTPSLERQVRAAADVPGWGKYLSMDRTPEQLKKIIQSLADAFHTGLYKD